MIEKLKGKAQWLRKVAVCLVFFGLFKAKEAQAYGLPPLINVSPVGITVHNGDTVTFTTVVGVSLTPVTVQWYFGNNLLQNGQNGHRVAISTVTLPIVGTTISTLTISNVNPGWSGKYWADVQNGGGDVKSDSAALVVLTPDTVTNVTLLTSLCVMTNGGFNVQLLKPSASNCVVEATTDLVHWTPIYTNTSGSTNVSYVDGAATNFKFRYYRARLK